MIIVIYLVNNNNNNNFILQWRVDLFPSSVFRSVTLWFSDSEFTTARGAQTLSTLLNSYRGPFSQCWSVLLMEEVEQLVLLVQGHHFTDGLVVLLFLLQCLQGSLKTGNLCHFTFLLPQSEWLFTGKWKIISLGEGLETDQTLMARLALLRELRCPGEVGLELGPHFRGDQFAFRLQDAQAPCRQTGATTRKPRPGWNDGTVTPEAPIDRSGLIVSALSRLTVHYSTHWYQVLHVTKTHNRITYRISYIKY